MQEPLHEVVTLEAWPARRKQLELLGFEILSVSKSFKLCQDDGDVDAVMVKAVQTLTETG